jgi:hypothetical protein
MINKLKTEALQGGGFTIDIKTDNQCASAGYTTGNLNFISVGLDPTQGNKLSYSTLHFGQCYKTIGKHSLLFGANYEHFKSSNLFFWI